MVNQAESEDNSYSSTGGTLLPLCLTLLNWPVADELSDAPHGLLLQLQRLRLGGLALMVSIGSMAMPTLLSSSNT
jgi:hypothetical protein